MGLSGVLHTRRMKVFLISVLYLSAVAALPHQDRQGGCMVPPWVGDGVCDDFNNFADCNFDGGDCCGSNGNTSFCHECKCKQAAATTAAPATTAASATTTASGGSGGSTSCATIPSWMKTAMSAVTGFDRIINGAKASSPIPWQAHIRETGHTDGGGFCGGTILDATTVLTAAHCFWNNGVTITDFSKYFIAAGHTKVTDSAAQTAKVKSVTLHPNFDQSKSGANDIAIIKLKTALTLNAKVKPACLPAATLTLSGAAVASGWGLVGQKPNKATSDLMYIATPVMTKAQCIKNTSWTAGRLTDQMICAGYAAGGKSTCHGDSGGPLVIAGANDAAVVVGATSFGSAGGCGAKGYPAVYAYTVPFLSWIKSKMG